jgi:hypothetical protein
MLIGMGANAPKEDIMKKTFLIALFLLIWITLAFPQPGYSMGHSFYGPAVAVGAGVALLGAVIGSPVYGYYGPQVAYGYPPPAYRYPAPTYGYGYPYYGPRHSGYRYYGSYAGRGHYGRRW